LNGFESYAISPSTINALVQPLMVDSELQLTQILNAVFQLAKSRPQLSQLVTSLFSSLDTYLSQGESRLSAARRTVEQWFDDAMDRASGWYKRSAQLWLGVVGLVLACLLNVDTISVATALWRDPTLRQSALEQAEIGVEFHGWTTPSSPAAAPAIRDLNTQQSGSAAANGWRTVHQLQAGEACILLPTRVGDV
jgi:hypothetical protein